MEGVSMLLTNVLDVKVVDHEVEEDRTPLISL